MSDAPGPARGYSWPPFEQGNAVAERHGAHSERRWRPIAERLASDAVIESPWLGRPSFRAAVAAWSIAEAQCVLVDRYLNDHGLLDDKGVPRPATALSDRLHRRAQHLRSQLGLDPSSMAKLLATFAGVPGVEDALDALVAEGRRIVEARGIDSRSVPAGPTLPADRSPIFGDVDRDQDAATQPPEDVA
jgi:hypothetical protein